MNEKQAIAALDRQVVILTRQNMAQREQIASLARTVALMADAMAQHLDGRMSQRDAVSALYGLNSSAAQVMHAA